MLEFDARKEKEKHGKVNEFVLVTRRTGERLDWVAKIELPANVLRVRFHEPLTREELLQIAERML